MKKLLAIALIFVSLFTITTASAERRFVIDNVQNYADVIEYDAGMTAEGHEFFVNMEELVEMLGDEFAEDFDLGLVTYEDGSVAIRHQLPAHDGYTYYVYPDFYEIVEENGTVHVLFRMDLVDEIILARSWPC